MEQPPEIPSYSFDMSRTDWIVSFLTLGVWYRYKMMKASEKYDMDYLEHVLRMNSWLKRRGIDYQMGSYHPSPSRKE